MNIEFFIKKNKFWQEDCPGVGQTAYLLALAFIRQNEVLGKTYQHIAIMLLRDDYLYELTLVNEKKNIFEFLKKQKFSWLNKKIDEWKKHSKKLVSFLGKINSSQLSRLSNGELNTYYVTFMDLAGKSWAYPIMGEACDPFSTYDLIPLIEKKLRISYEEAREIGITLSLSRKKSFLDQERLELLKISLLSGSRFSQAIKKHALRYYWLKNNYLTSSSP